MTKHDHIPQATEYQKIKLALLTSDHSTPHPFWSDTLQGGICFELETGVDVLYIDFDLANVLEAADAAGIIVEFTSEGTVYAEIETNDPAEERIVAFDAVRWMEDNIDLFREEIGQLLPVLVFDDPDKLKAYYRAQKEIALEDQGLLEKRLSDLKKEVAEVEKAIQDKQNKRNQFALKLSELVECS